MFKSNEPYPSASQPAPILPDSYYLGFNYHRQHRSIENGTCLHIMNNSHLRNDAFIAYDDCLLPYYYYYYGYSHVSAATRWRSRFGISTSKIPATRRNENTHGTSGKEWQVRRSKGRKKRKEIVCEEMYTKVESMDAIRDSQNINIP